MSDKQQPNLEYNDGLGDMLREKKSASANVNRSILVAAGIVLVSVAIFAVAFKWGTELLFRSTPKPIKLNQQTPREKEIEQENKALIREMEALLARATGDVSHPTDAPPTQNLVASRSASPVAKPGSVAVTRSTKVSQKGVVSLRVTPKSATGLFRVVSGPYGAKSDATLVSTKIQGAGYSTYIKAEPTGFFVQAGAFSTQETAGGVVSQLARRGISAVVLAPK